MTVLFYLIIFGYLKTRPYDFVKMRTISDCWEKANLFKANRTLQFFYVTVIFGIKPMNNQKMNKDKTVKEYLNLS